MYRLVGVNCSGTNHVSLQSDAAEYCTRHSWCWQRAFTPLHVSYVHVLECGFLNCNRPFLEMDRMFLAFMGKKKKRSTDFFCTTVHCTRIDTLE